MVLTVNTVYDTGIGIHEMNGGNWKIYEGSVEYRSIEIFTIPADLMICFKLASKLFDSGVLLSQYMKIRYNSYMLWLS